MTGRDDLFSIGDLEERIKRAGARVLPKRFYKEVGVAAQVGAYLPLLDGRPIKTPGKRALAVPAEALARAIGDEWAAQGKTIDPATMPLTRLVNTVIDTVTPARAGVIAEIVAYAGSDLLCYRAEAPRELAERQDELWTPILHWVREALGARMVLAVGVMPVEQPAAALARIEAAVSDFDDFTLAAAASMTNLTGSALLALAVCARRTHAGQAWAAAHVDEDFQITQWGADAEAAARRAGRWRDMEAAARLLDCLRD